MPEKLSKGQLICENLTMNPGFFMLLFLGEHSWQYSGLCAKESCGVVGDWSQVGCVQADALPVVLSRWL